jgi:hypothetical protein
VFERHRSDSSFPAYGAARSLPDNRATPGRTAESTRLVREILTGVGEVLSQSCNLLLPIAAGLMLTLAGVAPGRHLQTDPVNRLQRETLVLR